MNNNNNNNNISITIDEMTLGRLVSALCSATNEKKIRGFETKNETEDGAKYLRGREIKMIK